MASNRTPFPFPPLPEGEVTPWPGPGDRQELLQRDVRIIRWFLQNGGDQPHVAAPDSTLGNVLSMSEQVDLNGAADAIESQEAETAHHALHLFAVVGRVAWAVRALYGTEGALGGVDASFIEYELLGDDSKQRGVRTLPAGVGTLVIAARLVQAGRGCITSIRGHRGIGHDIKWVTGQGDTVYVERKDRTYEAGLADKPEWRSHPGDSESRPHHAARARRCTGVGRRVPAPRPQAGSQARRPRLHGGTEARGPGRPRAPQ